MEITKEDFLKKFAEVFEETDPSLITYQTKFKELDEWDSMTALSVIAMADDEFDVKVKGEDIRNSTILQELYDKISK